MKKINLRYKTPFFLLAILLILTFFGNYRGSKWSMAEEISGQQKAGVETRERMHLGQRKGVRYVPGKLIVKFKDTVTECVHSLLEQKKPFSTVVGTDTLDKLNEKWSVTSAESLFVGRHGVTTAEAKRRLIKKVKRVRARFKKRTQRAIRGRKIKSTLETLSNEEKGKVSTLANIYILEVPEDTDISTMASDYEKNPHVEYAEPMYIPTMDKIPTDPMYDEQWSLKADKLNMEPAWEISQGDGVVVAVIDSGVDYLHEDLTEDTNGNGILDPDEDANGNGVIDSSIWVNPGEDINNNGIVDPDDFNGIDDDDNDYVDDLRGWNFSGDNNDPMEINACHGTPVSGIIAAMGDNGKGIIGIAPKAKIMALTPYPSDVRTLIYAADNGAYVINSSWGSPPSRAIEDAVNYAHDVMGCIIVASAGNDGGDVRYHTPAGLSNTIAVAASGQDDEHSFSCWGSAVDVAAPFGVPSLYPHSSYDPSLYGPFGGTSSSAPHVAGLCALILSLHPEYSPEEVREVLHLSADDIEYPGWDPLAGYGRINAFKALTTTPESYLTAIVSVPSYGVLIRKGEEIEIKGNSFGPDFSSYELYIAKGKSPQEEDFTSQGITLENSGTIENKEESILGKWDTSFLTEDGEYTIRLLVYDSYSDVREARTVVFIDSMLQKGWPYDTGSSRMNSHIVAGDINGDGASEIVVDISEGEDEGYYPKKLLVINGAGELREDLYDIDLEKEEEKFQHNFTPGVSMVDVDGELGDEIVTSVGKGSKVMAFRYDGSVPDEWTPYEFNDGIFTYGERAIYEEAPIVTTDIDGNGKNEFVLLTTVEEHGREVIPKIAILNHDGSLRWESDPSALEGLENLYGLVHMFVGDMDNNGVKEIGIVSEYAQKVHLLDVSKGESFNNNFPIEFPEMRQLKITAGDVNGDGFKEIVIQGIILNLDGEEHSSSLKVFVYDYEGMLKAEKVIPESDYTSSYLALADVDEDGDAEIITASMYKLYVLDGATLESLVGWPADIPSAVDDISQLHRYKGLNMVSLVSGDIDGNGDIEIIVLYTEAGISHSASVRIWNHDGSPWKEGWCRNFVGATLSGVLTDTDGDGDMDLVVSSRGTTDVGQGSQIFVWDFDGEYDPERIEWGMLHGDSQHTNVYIPKREPILYGDVSGNGTVSGYDAALINQYLVGILTLSEDQLKAADVTQNREVTWLDAAVILKFVIDIIDKLPIENHAPELAVVGSKNKQVTLGETLEFTIKTSDPEPTPLSYADSVLPEGARIYPENNFNDNPKIATFKWTPSKAGRYKAKINVTDYELSDTQAVYIKVKEPAQPPVVIYCGAWPRVTYKGQLVRFYGYGYDPNGNRIVGYRWYMKRKGRAIWLGNRWYLHTNRLPVGTHRIYFKVKNDEGIWSKETEKASCEVRIKRAPRRKRPWWWRFWWWR